MPPVIVALRRANSLDVPNHRSSHQVPTPRGGGIAILAGIAAAGLTAAAVGQSWSDQALACVAACTALALVGLADDVFSLAPVPRLLAQVVIGGVVGAFLGGFTGAALGAVVIPAAVNMVNFMDGINGLCAGHAAVWGTGALLASRTGGSETIGVLGALALGGGLGFLPWNAPRARLFLGDVGSDLFGALAGVAVVACFAQTVDETDSLTSATVVGLVCAPYFLFALDTSVAIVRRLSAREPVFVAHRSHVYQRLVNEGGLPHWVVSAFMAGASLLITLAVAWHPAAGLILAVVTGAAYLLSPRLRRVAVTA